MHSSGPDCIKGSGSCWNQISGFNVGRLEPFSDPDM